MTDWPRKTGGSVWSSPALGDIDGDGEVEVVVGSDDTYVWAFNCHGTYSDEGFPWPKFHQNKRNTGLYTISPPKVTIVLPAEGAVLPTADVTVNWTSDSVTGIDHYEVRLDGGSWINVLTNTSRTFYDLPNGPHTVYVMAFGIVGTDDTDSVSFTVDTKPPTVTIVLPSGGAMLPTSDVTVNWICVDNGRIDHYEVCLDGGSWISVLTNTSHTFYDLSNGLHTVEVKASDEAGNNATDSVSFTVDANPPEVTIILPGNGSVLPTVDVTVIWTCVDNGRIDHYEVCLDGGSWINVLTNTSHTFYGLLNGSHTVEVRAFDDVGNDATDSVSFTVDPPPMVTITAPGQDLEFSTSSVIVNWTVVDENLEYCMYRLDGGEWVNIGSATTFTFTNLSSGSHTVEILACDLAGHNSTDTVSFIVNLSEAPLLDFGPVLISLILMQQQGVPMDYLVVVGVAAGVVVAAVGLGLWLRRR